MEIKRNEKLAPVNEGQAPRSESTTKFVCEDESFAVFERPSRNDEGEMEFSVKNKAEGHFTTLRGQVHGTALTGAQVLDLMAGKVIAVKSVPQSGGKSFTAEYSVKETAVKDGKPNPETGKVTTYRTAYLGQATRRINGDGEVFGYSLNHRTQPGKDGVPIKARFLKDVAIGDGHVTLTSKDCWTLLAAGVGSPVKFADGQVELTLAKLEEKLDGDPGQEKPALYAHVSGQFLDVAAEQSESTEEAQGQKV